MPDEDEDDAADEEQRGLEETLEKLGLGAYHWRLLVSLLEGFSGVSSCLGIMRVRVDER